MPRDKSVAEVKAELQRVLAPELATRKFSYPRSDGSAWTLTLRNTAPGSTSGAGHRGRERRVPLSQFVQPFVNRKRAASETSVPAVFHF